MAVPSHRSTEPQAGDGAASAAALSPEHVLAAGPRFCRRAPGPVRAGAARGAPGGAAGGGSFMAVVKVTL